VDLQIALRLHAMQMWRRSCRSRGSEHRAMLFLSRARRHAVSHVCCAFKSFHMGDSLRNFTTKYFDRTFATSLL